MIMNSLKSQLTNWFCQKSAFKLPFKWPIIMTIINISHITNSRFELNSSHKCILRYHWPVSITTHNTHFHNILPQLRSDCLPRALKGERRSRHTLKLITLAFNSIPTYINTWAHQTLLPPPPWSTMSLLHRWMLKYMCKYVQSSRVSCVIIHNLWKSVKPWNRLRPFKSFPSFCVFSLKYIPWQSWLRCRIGLYPTQNYVSQIWFSCSIQIFEYSGFFPLYGLSGN